MDQSDVNAVSVKLPTFWSTSPVVWFQHIEAQFAIRGITQDSTRYHYVVSALDQGTATRLVDLLANPPSSGKYLAIKRALLDTYGLSRRERASKLLHFHSMGDRKPSEIMDEILSLLAGHKPCFLAEQIFLEQLPEDIRLQLAESDFQDPREVARRADVMWLAKREPPVHQIHVHRVATEVSSELCWYHKKFGKKAKKCITPCNLSGNFQASRQ